MCRTRERLHEKSSISSILDTGANWLPVTIEGTTFPSNNELNPMRIIDIYRKHVRWEVEFSNCIYVITLLNQELLQNCPTLDINQVLHSTSMFRKVYESLFNQLQLINQDLDDWMEILIYWKR